VEIHISENIDSILGSVNPPGFTGKKGNEEQKMTAEFEKVSIKGTDE